MTYILTYLLNLFDLCMTMRLVKLYGIGVEANPFGRWLFETGAVVLYKTAVVPVMLALLCYGVQRHPKYRWLAYAVCAVYGLLAVWHVIILGISL